MKITYPILNSTFFKANPSKAKVNNIKPIRAFNNPRYSIEQTDTKSANKINNTYVDYGGVIAKRR